MPGTEANIGVDIPPTIDQRLDARRVTQTGSGFAVDREAVVVADPVSTDEIARVTSAEGLDVDVTRLPALPAGTNNIGDVDVASAVTSHTRNEAFKQSEAIGGELDDTASVAATEGNISPARITAQRALHVNLRNNGGTEIGTSSNRVFTNATQGAGGGVSSWNVRTEYTGGITDTLSGVGQTLSVDVRGQEGAHLFLGAGTLDATLIAEVSGDLGASWSSAQFIDPTSGAVATSIVVTNPSPVIYRAIGWAGTATHARVRVSAFTSGSATGELNAVTARTYAVAYGSDGTNLRALKTSTGGALSIDQGISNPLSVRLNDGGAFQGSAANPLRTDPTGTTAQPVTDNSGTLTVDAPIGTPVNVQVGDGTRTATVRDTGTSDSLNVAIVDAAGAQITTFGGGTEYTEDVATPADPVGGAALVRRRDTPPIEPGVDGDWVAQNGTKYGAAYAQIVTSSGAFVDSFGGAGGTAQADESAFTEGTTNFTPVGGVLNDTITSDPIEDQAAAARITAKRALHVNLRTNSGAEIGTIPSPVYISGSDGAGFDLPKGQLTNAAVVNRGDLMTAQLDDTATSTPAEDQAAALRITSTRALHVQAQASTNNIGDVDVLTLPAIPAGTNNIGDVDVLTLPAIPAGTNNIGDVDVLTLPETPGYDAITDERLVVTTAGTRVNFPSVAVKVVALTAETDNTGVVVVGGSTVVAAQATRRGTPLSAGDTAILAVTNLNLLWLDSTVSGDGVTYTTLG